MHKEIHGYFKILHYIYRELLPDPTGFEKYQVIREHYQMMIEAKGEERAVKEMRKHLAWYLKGIPGAARIRSEVFALSSSEQVLLLIEQHLCNGTR